eukprot:EG_transcript_1593
MRLTFIFLAVLAASVVVTSLAAWGITYGVSYSRVTKMASEFTQLGLTLLQLFDAFVSGLLRSNSDLVNNILALERQSGDARMQQTKAQVLRIISSLVNYATNATAQSQQQMNLVVDTFANLMGTVFAEFKGVTITCASDLRSELAAKVSTFITNFVAGRTNVLLRFQSLQTLRLINLSRTSSDPVTGDDCLLLGVVCDSAMEFGIWGNVYLVTAAGRLFYCIPAEGAYISQISINGTEFTDYRQTWLPNGQYNYRERCETETPVSVVVGQGCSLPQGCQCGADERCATWYKPYINYSAQQLMVSDVYIGRFDTPQVTISYPIVNKSATSPSLLAAAATDFPFIGAQNVLQSINMPPGTIMATFLNDTYFSQMSAIARKCAPNETAPGAAGLPAWSLLQTCDPDLQQLAAWLLQNRAAVQAQVSVHLSGVAWDIYPNPQFSMQYFIVVGAKDEDTYRTIDSSAANASTQLSVVRVQLLSQVAASGIAAMAYMAALQAENMREVQAMQDEFVAQMDELENMSLTKLAVSQQSSTSEVNQLMASQTQQVDALKSKHLSAMTTATGWILGVVFAILGVVLLSSAWGTIRVAQSLNDIISLMEDVAGMKVENLEVPQRSQVTEVARIETAFQVLVVRLAEYKSYMPASLFQKTIPEDLEDPSNDVPLVPPTIISAQDHAEDGSESDQSGTEGERTSSQNTVPGIPSSSDYNSSGRRVTHISTGSSGAGVPRSPTKKAWKRSVTVLTVNVTRFRDTLPTLSEGAVRSAFSQYISTIHEVVSKDNGNLDCLLGDQVFVTFNAHIPCADPPGSAATAALNIQSRLQTGDRMHFQIGASYGPAYAGVVGYSKFKTMVTMGDPMKVAAMLSHIPDFENASVVADTHTEEKLQYSFNLRPAEVVHFAPKAGCGSPKAAGPHTPSTGRVFLLQKKKQLKEDEWMYQLDSSPSDWSTTFSHVEKAHTLAEMHGVLSEYLAAHPQDPVALRLRARLPLWVPGVGVPL